MAFNFEKDTAIDPDELDEEWLRQPSLSWKYNKALADAEKKVKEIWEKKKIIRSRLTKEAKENGASNAALQEAYYREHKDHIAAANELIDVEYERDLIKGAVFAIQDKKKALEQILKGILSEFFSAPKQSSDLVGGKRIEDIEQEGATKKAREAINSDKPRSRRRGR